MKYSSLSRHIQDAPKLTLLSLASLFQLLSYIVTTKYGTTKKHLTFAFHYPFSQPVLHTDSESPKPPLFSFLFLISALYSGPCLHLLGVLTNLYFLFCIKERNPSQMSSNQKGWAAI